jgi:hypothetical protein
VPDLQTMLIQYVLPPKDYLNSPGTNQQTLATDLTSKPSEIHGCQHMFGKLNYWANRLLKVLRQILLKLLVQVVARHLGGNRHHRAEEHLRAILATTKTTLMPTTQPVVNQVSSSLYSVRGLASKSKDHLTQSSIIGAMPDIFAEHCRRAEPVLRGC